MNTVYYSTPYATTRAATPAGAEGVVAAMMGMGVIFWIAVIALAVLTVVAQWKVFKKANVDGWEALIPIHSSIVELQLGGVKTYWYFINLVIICGIEIDRAQVYVPLLALFPFVCYPILAWGNAEYVGPQTNETPKTTTEA